MLHLDLSINITLQQFKITNLISNFIHIFFYPIERMFSQVCVCVCVCMCVCVYIFMSKFRVCMVKGIDFSSSDVRMWELCHKESWALKNWCFRIVVLEKPLESPLDSKEIKSVNLLGNQPRIFIGRTESEAEAPTLWPHDANNRLFGKDWCWEGLIAGEEGRDKGWDS